MKISIFVFVSPIRYFVLNEDGSSDTEWWDSDVNDAGHIDFTNPEAAEWWYDRILDLVQEFNLDSLKFDAGEISHSPQVSLYYFINAALLPSVSKERWSYMK